MERAFKGIWIPKEVWLSKELSLQEKVFIVEIDSLDNDNGCFASNKHFAEFFGLSNGRVSQVINSLHQKGYIDVEYQKEGRQIIKRIMSIKRPPYPIKYSKEGYLGNDNRGIKYSKEGYLGNDNRGIKYSKEGYLGNDEDNNTSINNTNVNNTNVNNVYIPYKEIIDCLNQFAGTHYKYETKKTMQLIKARFNEGFTLADFQTVIKKKCDEWIGTKYEMYLRPDTLFGAKFEGYLNQRIVKETNKKDIFLQMLMEEDNAEERSGCDYTGNIFGLPEPN